MHRTLSTVLWACLGIVLGTGCGKKKDSITIGAAVPLTGNEATFGLSTRRGIELAVAEWNARGGVLGRPILLFVEDDKGEPAEGASSVTRLIHQRKAVGIVGLPMSKVALAGAPVAQEAGIPLVASSATSLKVTQVGDFIFRACFVDQFQGSAAAGFAFQELKARKAACLFDLANPYATGTSETFKAAFTRLGGDVVAFEGHAPGSPDIQAQLAKVLHPGPDVIYAPDFYGDAAFIAQQARGMGFRGPLLGADGWDSPKLIELGKHHLENTFFTTHFTPQDPSPTVQAFVQSFKVRHREVPDGHAAMGYDAALILLDGIHRAGTPEGRAVRDAIARSNLRLVTGQITFDAQRNPIKPIVFMEVKGGRPVFRMAKPTDPAGEAESAVSPHPERHEVRSLR
jgi:branched-chain amino acid transport system substrate-binding protein